MPFAVTELEAAVQALDDLIGHVAADDVLGRVFADFCVGK
jgi:tRNA U34 5-carboxymethylaminomethyl modifying GTPase MnmE/TrmE